MNSSPSQVPDHVSEREAIYCEVFGHFSDLLASRPREVVIDFNPSRGLGKPDLLDIKCSRADYGLFIGRKADHIQAIQRIFEAISKRWSTPVRIVIHEPTVPAAGEPTTKAWHPDLLSDIGEFVYLILSEIGDPAADVNELHDAGPDFDSILVRSTRLGDLGEAIKVLVWAIGKSHGRKVKTEFGEVPA